MPRIKVYFRGKQLLDPDAQVVEKVKSDEGVANKALNFDPGFDQLLQISEESISLSLFIFILRWVRS